MVGRSLTEKIFENRNLRQPGDSSQRLGLRIVHDPADQARLTVAQADFAEVDFFLSNDGLSDAANAGLPDLGGDFHDGLERDLATGMHVRGYINVHADIDILKTAINQRVNSHAADA